jgi:hypothetical protein
MLARTRSRSRASVSGSLSDQTATQTPRTARLASRPRRKRAGSRHHHHRYDRNHNSNRDHVNLFLALWRYTSAIIASCRGFLSRGFSKLLFLTTFVIVLLVQKVKPDNVRVIDALGLFGLLAVNIFLLAFAMEMGCGLGIWAVVLAGLGTLIVLERERDLVAF